MENKAKILLTMIGLGAIIVPAVLLVVFSGRGQSTAGDASNGGNRQIRQDAVQNEINNNPLNSVVVSPSPAVSAKPTPTPSPKSATTPKLEGTPASGVN